MNKWKQWFFSFLYKTLWLTIFFFYHFLLNISIIINTLVSKLNSFTRLKKRAISFLFWKVLFIASPQYKVKNESLTKFCIHNYENCVRNLENFRIDKRCQTFLLYISVRNVFFPVNFSGYKEKILEFLPWYNLYCFPWSQKSTRNSTKGNGLCNLGQTIDVNFKI